MELNFLKDKREEFRYLYEKVENTPPLNLPGWPIYFEVDFKKGENKKRIRSPFIILSVGILFLAGYAGYQLFTEEKVQNANNVVGDLLNLGGAVKDIEIQPSINMNNSLEFTSEEEPIIATVANVEVLKDKPFFAGAKEGDLVFIYSKARKAVLYDPVAEKILNIAPIDVEPEGE